ncbi:MAG: capsular polysaccharide biosynthesis protein [Ruminococcus sp.]|uniref:CpsB/CapC family capsule biosynthesis tyrosine phosphatase n=1 Tax=Ruminococcus sp. TaxID=41978 RepID=UPI0025F65374|nr:CpsB/CapC family capsule biosynthesis tyrosine phosphatase [Ruminococcus sp.]MCR5600741.1 capsular polysaccharide biosynthesis protein [Ruminococcus sp.]
MLTEYHCHVLPGIDDGADKVETSLAMLDIMKEQNVERVIFTPHFYCHRERSVERFLEKRQEAFEAIKDKSPIKNMLLGAEVAIENGLSEVKDIEKLAVQGTKLIMLELPYRDYVDWMSEEIYNISAEHGLKIILAHVHRYLEYYSKEQLEKILSSDCIMQVNNEAFTSWSEKKLVKNIIKDGRTIVFGSDAHNISDRKPNWDILQKKVKPEIIEASDSVFGKFTIKK